jgi:hypothetical protein
MCRPAHYIVVGGGAVLTGVASYVFVRHDVIKKPLQLPYNDVLEKSPRYYTLDLNSCRDTVSIDEWVSWWVHSTESALFDVAAQAGFTSSAEIFTWEMQACPINEFCSCTPEGSRYEYQGQHTWVRCSQSRLELSVQPFNFH